MKKQFAVRPSALRLALFAGAMAVAAGFAPAQAQTRIGTLECNVSGGVGFVITSAKALSCAYIGANGQTERYTGTIRRFGLDIGFTGPGKMVWGVFAPSQPGPGSLQGEYIGATASASAGAGVGANALIGGLERSISLQPLSIQVQSGIDIAAGVGAMTLDYVR